MARIGVYLALAQQGKIRAMRTVLIALAATTLSFAGLASAFGSKPNQPTPTDSAWVQVGYTDENVFSIRKGSFEITQTKAGTPIAVVTVQSTEKKTQSITYRREYVTKDDCLSGLGKLVILDTNGQYMGQNDFVSDGDSIASTIATLICRIYKEELEKQSDKSI
jgi:hypothetical protein